MRINQTNPREEAIMHHSKVCTLVIDCQGDTMEDGIAFWSRALGLHPEANVKPDQKYVALEGPAPRLKILLQRVPDHSAFHLDIESDQIEQEVVRLERLGARRKYKIQSWWVMESPTGHAFCVVRPQHEDFPVGANRWPGEADGETS